MNIQKLEEQIRFFAYSCAHHHGAEIEKIEIKFKKMKSLKFSFIADEPKVEEE